MNTRMAWIHGVAAALVLGNLVACDRAEETDEIEELESASSELVASHGRYLVANAYTGKASFYIQAKVVSGNETVAQRLPCELTVGALSMSARCPGLANPPVTVLADDGEPNGRVIRVGFASIGQALIDRGFTVLELSAASEPSPLAEAVWENGHWVCQASQTDIDACNSHCASHGGSGTVSVDEEIPSNNLALEPSCEVTCACKDGSETVHLDPPQVMPF